MMVLWLVLNVFIAGFMDLALFVQTKMPKKSPFVEKLGASELAATLEWMFIIPANRIGNKFLSAAQISLASFLFDFLGQIVTNTFWLKIETTLDDYLGMVLIFLGMYCSTYKVFG